MEDQTHSRITHGPILKSIIFLMIPILIGNLLQTAFQITDAFWLGRLGKDAIAAVSVSFPILFLVMTLSGGIGLGGAVLVAQYKGRKDEIAVNDVTGQTLLLAFIISIIFSIIGYIFTPQILQLFNIEQSVFAGATNYLRISFIGMIFIFGYMVYQSLSRAVGDAKTPVYFILAGVILNLFLDPLFIFGYGFIPKLGVSGAAMATVVTQSIGLIGGLIVMSRGKKGILLKLSNFKINKKLIKKIITLGFPISLEQSSRSFGFLLLTGIAASFGTVALASYGIGMQMFSLVIIPALSLAIANSALVGQNIGAGKINRAEKITNTSIIFGFIVLTFLGILFFIFAPFIVSIFIPGETEVIKQGSLFLRLFALSFGFIGIQMAILGAIRGSGNPKTTLLISGSVVFVQVVFAFIFTKYIMFDVLGLWISFPISSVFGAILAYIIFKKGKWKKKKII